MPEHSPLQFCFANVFITVTVQTVNRNPFVQFQFPELYYIKVKNNNKRYPLQQSQ